MAFQWSDRWREDFDAWREERGDSVPDVAWKDARLDAWTSVRDGGAYEPGGGQVALFSGYSEDGGYEPWMFDGERATLLRDLQPYGTGSDPYEFAVFDGDLYMATRPDYISYQLGNLVRFDGETGEASSIFIPPGRGRDLPDQLTEVDGDLYFAAMPFGTDVLYRLDGDSGVVEELWTSLGSITGLTAVRDDLYFLSSWEFGSSVLHVDTSRGLISEVTVGDEWNAVGGLTEVDGDLLMGGADGVVRIDGRSGEMATAPGVSLRVQPGQAAFVEGDNGAYFSGASDRTGHELFRLDPDDMEVRAFDLWRGSQGSAPADLTAVDDLLLFSADTAYRGRELLSLDEDTGRLRTIDINRGGGDSDPGSFLADGDTLYFTAFRPDVGRELFRYDGNRADLVADLMPGAESSFATALGVVNGVLAISYRDADGTPSLASLDGSEITLHDEVEGLAARPAFTVMDGDWMV